MCRARSGCSPPRSSVRSTPTATGSSVPRRPTATTGSGAGRSDPGRSVLFPETGASVSDETAFLEAIRARPWDEAQRQVYADWLEERGDDRADYLRAESATAK